MNIDDLRLLLPFFVGGTLGPEERQEVEEALKTSDELRKELEFWKRAKTAVANRVAHAAAGHLTPEQIVDRAMGVGTGDEVLAMDQHLQSCAQCSEEFHRVKESLDIHEAVKPSLFERILGIVRAVRLVYAVPALTVVIAFVVFYFSKTEKEPPGSPVASVPGASIAVAPAVDTALLWLTYEPEMRSASHHSLPTLALGEGEKHLRVFVAIPQNKVSGIHYRIIVTSPGRKIYRLQESPQRYTFGGGHDSLQFVLSREFLPPAGKTMTVTISELLPPTLRSLSPEEYRFEVEVRAKR